MPPMPHPMPHPGLGPHPGPRPSPRPQPWWHFMRYYIIQPNYITTNYGDCSSYNIIYQAVMNDGRLNTGNYSLDYTTPVSITQAATDARSRISIMLGGSIQSLRITDISCKTIV